jgi:hypothetical protein
VAKRGRPRKIPDPDKREALKRDYIAMSDYARLMGRSPDDALGRLAKRYHVKKRTIRRYLSEGGIRPIRAENKNISRKKQFKKNKRFIKKMKPKTG